ncbi:GHKL domain-containing protein [Eubacteriales bacterium OttesenSCG-928-A19]|nr:GHKL domain-containing protein [Eubacteriales bacterium OttesenSCG-928-A19]
MDVEPAKALFEVGINMLQCALTLYFGLSIFPSNGRIRPDVIYVIPFWLLASVLLSIFTFFRIPAWIPDFLPSAIILMLVTCLFRQGTFPDKAFWCVVYFFTCGWLTSLVKVAAVGWFGIPASALTKEGTSRIIYVIAVNAFLVAITMLLSRIARHLTRGFDVNRIDFGVLLAIIALPVASLAVLLGLLHAVTYIPHEIVPDLRFEIPAIAILVVNIFVLWLFDYIKRQDEHMRSLAAENLKIEAQISHYSDIAIAHRGMQAWQHDKNKHLRMLLSLAESNQTSRLHAYLVSLIESPDFQAISFCTGNLMMDAILSNIGNILKSEGTRFIVNMRLPEKLPVTDRDLTIIMWNLLENARDACLRIKEPEERFIRVAGLCNAHAWELQIVNSMRPAAKEWGVLGLTSKADKSKHGMGLHIVRQAVEQYSGGFSVKEEEQLYTANVLIPCAAMAELNT